MLRVSFSKNPECVVADCWNRAFTPVVVAIIVCFIRFNANLVPRTFMLRVTFSPAPECVVADCWNRVFPTPPCHQTPVVVVVVIVLYPPLQKAK